MFIPDGGLKWIVTLFCPVETPDASI
jgi:hypothetical protein